MPRVDLGVDLKSVDLTPKLYNLPELPKNLELPMIDLKDAIRLPDTNLPAVNLPSLDSLPSADPTTLSVLVGIGVLAVGAIAVALSGGGEQGRSSGTTTGPSKQKTTKYSLAIPYDAASRLAYDAWCAENNEKFDEAGYELFREVYNAKAVADATAKKKARDLATFKNEARKAPAPRKVSPPKQATTPKRKDLPFFANDA